MRKPGSLHHPGYHLREYRIIDRRGPPGGPDETLKSISCVDNPALQRVIHHSIQFYAGSIGLLASEVHKNEGCNFQPSYEHFYAWAGISATDPGVLLIGDCLQVPADRTDKFITEFNCPVFPVNLLLRGIEGVVCHHL